MILKTVNIWTDGSVSPKNPGIRGGWGAILSYGRIRRLVSGIVYGEEITNNMMETEAITRSLEFLSEPCEVYIYTDSRYVVSGIAKWLGRGKFHNTNREYWLDFIKSIRHHQIIPHHVAGHKGTPQNELAHKLAYFAAKYEETFDEKYETFSLALEDAKKRFRETVKASKNKGNPAR